MIWNKDKDGNLVTIKSMSNSEVKSNIHYLYKSTKEEINGFTVPFWIMSFKAELDKRKQLENVIINRLPYVRQKLNELTYNIRYSDEKFKI